MLRLKFLQISALPCCHQIGFWENFQLHISNSIIIHDCFIVLPFLDFQEDVLIPENLIFPFIRCCFKTQKVPDDVDSKDFTEHTGNDNKTIPYEDRYKENSTEVDSFMNTQKWMYEPPHREIVETQHIDCLWICEYLVYLVK